MENCVGPREVLVESRPADIILTGGDSGWDLFAHAVRKIVEADDCIAASQEIFGQVAADESGDPGDDDAFAHPPAADEVSPRASNLRSFTGSRGLTLPRPSGLNL